MRKNPGAEMDDHTDDDLLDEDLNRKRRMRNYGIHIFL